MSRQVVDDPIRLSIAVDDPALARRVVALLSNVEGLALVENGAPADLTVMATAEGVNADDREPRLTARELEVLALLAEGASNKLIARRLGVSTHTAKFHVAAVIDKLDAIGRTDAVAHAVRLGVIQL